MVKAAKIALLSVTALAVTAVADNHMSGNFEGGLTFSDVGSEARFIVDSVHMHKKMAVNDNTSFVMDTEFNAGTASAGTAPATPGRSSRMDGGNYGGPVAALANGARGMAALRVNGAYLKHSFGDNLSMRAGLVKVGFGIESMNERFDNHSHYYSTAYRVANGNVNGATPAAGWMYDVGFQFDITAFGNLQVGLYNGRGVGTLVTAASGFPALSAMWSYDIEAGKMTLTPVAYFYGNLGADIQDTGFGGGVKWKMGMIWANAEFIKINNQLGGTAYTQSIVIEPGVNIGDIGFSAKLDLADNNGATGADFGFALSNNYDKFRIKAVAMIQNAALHGTSGFDARLLFGTSW